MPGKAECEEYVLEEFGIIFAGNKNRISSFGWNFGQVNAALKQQAVLCALIFTWAGWPELESLSSPLHTPLSSRSLVLKLESAKPCCLG